MVRMRAVVVVLLALMTGCGPGFSPADRVGRVEVSSIPLPSGKWEHLYTDYQITPPVGNATSTGERQMAMVSFGEFKDTIQNGKPARMISRLITLRTDANFMPNGWEPTVCNEQVPKDPKNTHYISGRMLMANSVDCFKVSFSTAMTYPNYYEANSVVHGEGSFLTGTYRAVRAIMGMPNDEDLPKKNPFANAILTQFEIARHSHYVNYMLFTFADPVSLKLGCGDQGQLSCDWSYMALTKAQQAYINSLVDQGLQFRPALIEWLH